MYKNISFKCFGTCSTTVTIYRFCQSNQNIICLSFIKLLRTFFITIGEKSLRPTFRELKSNTVLRWEIWRPGKIPDFETSNGLFSTYCDEKFLQWLEKRYWFTIPKKFKMRFLLWYFFIMKYSFFLKTQFIFYNSQQCYTYLKDVP